ncbi:MAG: EI24 domain-containing protein [Gammaproteobacteria bacterium]
MGLRQLFNPRIFALLLLVLLLNLSLLLGFAYFLYEWMASYLPFKAWLDILTSWIPWLKPSFLTFAFGFLKFFLAMSLANYLLINISPIFLAPLYNWIAEIMSHKILSLQDFRLEHQTNSLGILTFIKNTMAREVKKTLYILPAFFLILASLLIPIINFFFPFFIFLFSSVVTALQYLDYYSDILNQPLEHSFQLMRENIFKILGFGCTITLINSLIPLFSCITSFVAVISSAYLYKTLNNKERSPQNNGLYLKKYK